MITIQVPNITVKQIDFIRDLAAKRDWREITDPTVTIAIKIVLAWTPDDGELQLARKRASHVIDTLLKTKFTSKIVTTATASTTTSLSPKAAAQAAITDIPGAAKGIKYAIKNTDPNSPNTWVFYEVKEWKGQKLLNRLQGAPGNWHRQFVNYASYASVARRINDVGAKQAAFKFAEIYTVCACCGSPLSNSKSIAEGFGPICIKKFS